MRAIHILTALALFLFAAACSDTRPPDPSQQNTTATASGAALKPEAAPTGRMSAPSVASSHGGGANTTGSNTAAADKPPVETPELDAKVEKAVAKARAAGATAADKQAAADALMARGNFYYEAGNPRLYRFALGDFRQALRYEPDNAEAKEKIEMMESIYRSMGKPVPDNGLEP